MIQKEKVRPIDDYKANQMEVITLHGLIIACTGASILRAFANAGKEALVAKCRDLASAYKEMPLSDEAYRLDSFLVVFNPKTGEPEIYQQAILPFGPIASVTAFLGCDGHLASSDFEIPVKKKGAAAFRSLHIVLVQFFEQRNKFKRIT